MIRLLPIATLLLFSSTLLASADSDAAAALALSSVYTKSAYELACEKAIAEDKPLLVFVGEVAIGLDSPGDIDKLRSNLRSSGISSVDVSALTGYSSGDVVWSAPFNGKLYHVATIKNPDASDIIEKKPKRVMTGCESGKCTPVWAIPGQEPCSGAACKGRMFCEQGGNCNSCSKCNAVQIQGPPPGYRNMPVGSATFSGTPCSTGNCGASTSKTISVSSCKHCQ